MKNKQRTIMIGIVIILSTFFMIYGFKGEELVPNSEKKQVDVSFDLKGLYEDPKSWESDFSRLQKEVNGFSRYEYDLTGASKAYETLLKLYDRLYTFAMLNYDTHLFDSEAELQWTKINDYNTVLTEKTQFYLNKVYETSEEEAAYAHIKNLSETLVDSPENIYRSYMYEMPNPESIVVKDMDKYSNDRNVRKMAYDNEIQKVQEGLPILSSTLEAEVKANTYESELDGFDDPVAYFILNDGIDYTIYENLLDSSAEMNILMDLFFKVRQEKIHDENPLKYFDRTTPNDKSQKVVTLEDTLKNVEKSLIPLGPEYLNAYKRISKEKWADLTPREGKYTGAYTYSAYDGHPYILMNYNEDVESSATYTHEAGHALNQLFSNQNQSYQNAYLPLINTEISAIVNEILYYRYLLDQTKDKTEREQILYRYLDFFNGTYYYQMALAKFQDQIHRDFIAGKPLSEAYFSNAFESILVQQYGAAYEVDQYDRIGWADVDHLYWDFYVYKYPLALLIACKIVDQLQTDPTFYIKYVEFLKNGSASSLEEALNKMEISLKDRSLNTNFKQLYSHLLQEYQK